MATDINASWVDNSDNEDGFRIRQVQQATEPADWDVVPIFDTVPADQVTATLADLPDGVNWVNVRAFNSAGESVDEGTNIADITLPAGGPAVIMEDDFTGDGGINGRVPTPTPVGSNQWVLVTGEWETSAGRLRMPWTVQTSAYCEYDVEQTAYAIEASQTNNNCGLTYRFQNDQNHWRLNLDFANQQFGLRERTGNVQTDRGNTAAALVDGQFYTAIVRNEADNNHSVDVLEFSDPITSNLTVHWGQTKVGCRDFRNSGTDVQEWEYFKVTELP